MVGSLNHKRKLDELYKAIRMLNKKTQPAEEDIDSLEIKMNPNSESPTFRKMEQQSDADEPALDFDLLGQLNLMQLLILFATPDTFKAFITLLQINRVPVSVEVF